MIPPQSDALLVVPRADIELVLNGREQEIVDVVASAYVTHEAGESVLPHSQFLRFPDNTRDRIIALPAYLGGEFHAAGMKWVASFPGIRSSSTAAGESTYPGAIPRKCIEA